MNLRASGTLAGDSHEASKKVAAKKRNFAFGAKRGPKQTPEGRALRTVADACGCTLSHAHRCYYGERVGSPETQRIMTNVMRAAGLPERGVRSAQV